MIQTTGLKKPPPHHAVLYRLLQRKLKLRHVFVFKCVDLGLQIVITGLIALQFLLPPSQTEPNLLVLLCTWQYISIGIHLFGLRRPWTIRVRRHYSIVLLIMIAPFRVFGMFLAILLLNPVVTGIVAALITGKIVLAVLYPIVCIAELAVVIRKLKAHTNS